MQYINSKKIFTYSDRDNYFVCSCEISGDSLTMFRQTLKGNLTDSFELLHKFDNMLCSEIIDLGTLVEKESIDDMDVFCNVTSDFLDILEIKEIKKSSVDELSMGWSLAQVGSFGTDIDKNKSLINYKSARNNKKIMDTIGYKFNEKLNGKEKQKVKKKEKVASVSA